MKYFIFLLGLSIGSFLNVYIHRIPIGQSIIYPRSQCPKCKNSLKSIDLIPILSYLILKGKCRYCKDIIPVQYPFIECLNAFLYILLFIRYGITILFFKYSILTSLLIIISYIDLKYKIIPSICNVLVLILAVIFLFISSDACLWLNSLMGFLFGGLIFISIAMITNGMGGGDIRLMAVLGLAFGFSKIILIMMLSFIIGAIISIMLLIAKLKNRKDWIPFAPFISISAYIAMLFGDEIIYYYLIFFFNR